MSRMPITISIRYFCAL